MSESLIEFNNITKKFPRVIANNKVSFNINKSSVHALLGENGAGKSTLVKNSLWFTRSQMKDI